MKFAPTFLLTPLLLTAACTSVKVERHVTEKYPKVPANQVQFVSNEVAQARPHENIATINMRTHTANLPELARERTGQLGGNAYLLVGGETSSTLTGSLFSLVHDDRTSTMTIEALRWREQPAAVAPAAKKPAKGAAAAPAASTPPAKPAKTKAWWRPWSWF